LLEPWLQIDECERRQSSFEVPKDTKPSEMVCSSSEKRKRPWQFANLHPTRQVLIATDDTAASRKEVKICEANSAARIGAAGWSGNYNSDWTPSVGRTLTRWNGS
jgi:hypothetical protein